MTRSSGVLSLLSLLLVPIQSAAAADVTITGKMHHLRSGAEREWAEFPAQAEGTELVLAFDAKPNAVEQTLRLRHRDLKQSWRIVVNGTPIAQLPFDEADIITYWAVPAGTLRDGRNELRIYCTGRLSDDVLIGQVSLIERPAESLLSEATLHVMVDEGADGRGIPARITIADANGTLMSFGTVSGPQDAIRPGVVYSRGGAVRLKMPAGRYVIYGGRGFEYSVARAEVELVPGSSVSRRLTIRREVDTAGWAAMDTHLHTGTFAKHGDAAIGERMITIAGEGLELPVSTEHNMRVDFGAHARTAGLREHFTPVLGSEVTTPSSGHFNVFPIAPDAGHIDQRVPDWARLGEQIRSAAPEPVVVLNHGRDEHGGFRPLGRERHIGVAGEDLEGRALPANAMEIVNSGAVMTDGLALPRDWMGLLNRGVTLTPVGSSDSHDVSRYINGQGRTYVRCDDRDPGRIDLARAMENVRRGSVLVSYGLLTEIELEGKGPGDLVAPKDRLDVRIRVKGPGWTRAQHVALYVNGEKVRDEPIRNGTRGGVKWEDTWQLPRPVHDVHLVAVATGPGITAPYWPTAKPYQPTSIEFTPYVLGVSGAVFVDADRSGTFESAFEYARREVSASDEARPLVTRLAAYDVAVAIQAASLLRARDAAGFEGAIRSIAQSAPPHVAKGLTAYLEAWNESRAARGERFRPPAAVQISAAERQRLIAHLEMTAGWLQDEMSNLSQAQLEFRPAPGSWTILEVLDHLATVGSIYWEDLQRAVKGPPSERDLSSLDAHILWYGIDRADREKAIPSETPKGQIRDLRTGLERYRANHARLLQYAKTTTDDLRHRIVARQGSDAYQWALLISTHEQRHILQIREIKADPRFPAR